MTGGQDEVGTQDHSVSGSPLRDVFSFPRHPAQDKDNATDEGRSTDELTSIDKARLGDEEAFQFSLLLVVYFISDGGSYIVWR